MFRLLLLYAKAVMDGLYLNSNSLIDKNALAIFAGYRHLYQLYIQRIF